MARKKTSSSVQFDPLSELDLDLTDAIKEGIAEGTKKGAKEGSLKGFKEASAEKYQEIAAEMAQAMMTGRKKDPIDEQINHIERINKLKAMEATSRMLSNSIDPETKREEPNSIGDFQSLQLYLSTCDESEKTTANMFIAQGYKPKEIMGILMAMRQMDIKPEKSNVKPSMQEQLKDMMQMRVLERMFNPQSQQQPSQTDPNLELIKILIDKSFNQQQSQIPQQDNSVMTMMLQMFQNQIAQQENARRESEQMRNELFMRQILPQISPRSLSDELEQVQNTLGTLKQLGLIPDHANNVIAMDKELAWKKQQQDVALKLKEMELSQQMAERQARREEQAEMINTLLPMVGKFAEIFKGTQSNAPRDSIEDTRKIIQDKILKKSMEAAE